jgi:hypothetical protein
MSSPAIGCAAPDSPSSSAHPPVASMSSMFESFERFEDDPRYSYLFETGDSLIHYETEGTPICFSNDSPLSSLSFEMIACEPQSPTGPDFSSRDSLHNYFTEGTPICFSNDSPLSSLSLNLSFEQQDFRELLSIRTADGSAKAGTTSKLASHLTDDPIRPHSLR